MCKGEVSIMIKGLHHVQLTIPKGLEEAGKRFYCDVLQLPELEKPSALAGRGGFWVQVGAHEVHIGTEDSVDRFMTKVHIAYEVIELSVWKKRLEAENIAILESIPIPGYDRFEFRDPFGNRVEMIQRLLENQA